MTRKKDDWGLLVITSVVCDYMCSLRNLAKVVEMRDKKENQIIRTMHIPISVVGTKIVRIVWELSSWAI